MITRHNEAQTKLTDHPKQPDYTREAQAVMPMPLLRTIANPTRGWMRGW